ncbi:glycosyl hydrolase family 18 protein [Streptomyces sp. CMB-StM0423]|uniref:glycosyl hydrolase family 18 protein n=1 Tax=Streptomyces sp. CMB-StM0423 TaxID=2059884 RepID=UPI000C708940|nr:glycosyl hydrolase family 18 protein [Streptomyces sp. CMB-StM0423]AUH39052.1 chitinase [Streptomyces sp. CMB-StM0423]
MSVQRAAPLRLRSFPVSRRLLAVLAVLALALTGLTTLAPPASAQAGLTATFSSSGSGSSWTGKFVVANAGTAAVENWSLEFDLPAGVSISNHTHGTAQVDGRHVTVTPAYYNARVPAGRNTEPYSYTFTGSGPMTAPTGCLINGDKCDGSPAVPPQAPGGVGVADTTARTVTLKWNAATQGDFPVTSYEVLRGGAVVAASATTQATVRDLTPATSYQFTVRAKDSRGNEGPPSAPVTATTVDPATDTVPPTAPPNLRSTAVTSSTVALRWDAATDDKRVAAYDVHRGSALVASVPADTLTTTLTGLTPATQYAFTVRARDAADNPSPASNTLTVTTDEAVGQGGYAKVGYFVQWGIYGRQYFVKDLDTSGAAARMDVINYAFANIDPQNLTCLNGVTKGTTPNPQDPNQGDGAGDAEADYGRAFPAGQSVDGVADDGWGKLRGNFNQLKKLKAKHPHLKILISLGGWTYSKYFSDVAKTPASREKFVKSCIDMYIKGDLPAYNGAGGPGVAAGIFDGIDLDWEWPGSPDGHPGNHWSTDDKANNTALIAEFRRQLDALGGDHKLLTAFTPADPKKIDAGWDLKEIFTYMDFANVQGYDFHGSGSDNSWEPNRTGHQANLYPDAQSPYPNDFSIDGAVQHYLDAGVKPRKLTIGFPFYGRGWQQVADGGANGEWQSANGAAPGQFQEEAGNRGYDNLVAMVPNMTVHHDTQSVATYGYTGANGQWWSFDDTWAIDQKTAYIRQKGLLGGMVWEMSGDLPNGTLFNALDRGLP